MITIAVLSGKGGTGKTMVAVNLAALEDNTCYLDCDVEEPNGALFFKPSDIKETAVCLPIPVFDYDKCISCRECVDFCHFSALAFVAQKPILVADICHSCGGCSLFCKAGAIAEQDKEIGTVEIGTSGTVKVVSGRLKIGEPSGVSIISSVLEKGRSKNYTVVDCPPGSACTVMESIKTADYCILVAEPTAFGVQNLAMVHQLVSLFNKPVGAVLNKTTHLANPSKQYCETNNIPVLMELSYQQDIAASVSAGKRLVPNNKPITQKFDLLLQEIRGSLQNEKITGS